MERLMCIFNDEKYAQYLEKIKDKEKSRIYCRHCLEHNLDVARISYIINLEEGLGYEKELIYVASFLHDIGRGSENEDCDHAQESWNLAKHLLEKYCFKIEEISMVKEAILCHRKEQENGFARLIYRGDKLSRSCYECTAREGCYWPEDRKNKIIKY